MKEYKIVSQDILQSISEEISISSSFLEKDWYATQILYLLSNIKDKNFSPIFSGGTSLSKAYSIIKRFSEDLDFRIQEKNSTLNSKTLQESIVDFYKLLISKKHFQKEYQRFIINMCYEINSKNNTLNKSLKIFKNIFDNFMVAKI